MQADIDDVGKCVSPKNCVNLNSVRSFGTEQSLLNVWCNLNYQTLCVIDRFILSSCLHP